MLPTSCEIFCSKYFVEKVFCFFDSPLEGGAGKKAHHPQTNSLPSFRKTLARLWTTLEVSQGSCRARAGTQPHAYA